MACNFDIIYIRGNIIPHVDALCRLELGNEKVENHENVEDKVLHRVKTDTSLLSRFRIERRH